MLGHLNKKFEKENYNGNKSLTLSKCLGDYKNRVVLTKVLF